MKTTSIILSSTVVAFNDNIEYVVLLLQFYLHASVDVCKTATSGMEFSGTS